MMVQRSNQILQRNITARRAPANQLPFSP